MQSQSPSIRYQHLGMVPYREALAIQELLVKQRLDGGISDLALFLEHPAVITQGYRACAEDYRTTPEALTAAGIDVVRTRRGGRLTYHGPGQLIGYFICDTAHFNGVHMFVRAIESALITVCASFGIDAHREDTYPGVWVEDRKIAAIGLHVTAGISSHGFALNVACDLGPFRHIVPCGIGDRGVTSITRERGASISVAEARNAFVSCAPDAFGCAFTEAEGDTAESVVVGSNKGEV